MQAEEVLAKHDEEYMPPEVQEALDSAKQLGKSSSAYQSSY
jgi:cytochrome c-type biogenesis protein CcmE